MNITNIDWQDIHNKLQTRAEGSNRRIYDLEMLIPQHVNVFWDKLFQVLASIEPIKIDDKYSPAATMQSIPNEIDTPYGTITKDNFRAIVLMLDLPRSTILKGKAREHPQWSQLVPLWLAAYKHLRNINYNEWIRDSHIEYMIGYQLYKDIQEVPDGFRIDLDRLAELRKAALTTSARTWSIISPIQKQTDLGNGFIVRKNNTVGAMLLQIWLANVQVRHEDMILDPFDWELMPEPYDAQVDTINTISKKVPVRKLPF